VVLTVAGFVRLGIWQLDRAAEKLEVQAEYDRQQLQNADPIESLPTAILEHPREQLAGLHVALRGNYVNDRTVLVLAQFFDSQIGYEVVTPLRLAANGGLVLVSRGWTSGILPPNTPPRLQPVEGLVALKGQVYVPDEDARVFASRIDASRWPLEVRSIEIDVLESILGEPLFPYVVRLTEDQPGTLVRHWPQTFVDINMNLSYALQWFCFALIVTVVSVFASSNLLGLMRGTESGNSR
jgi:surfeit locus 1 family protein